MFPAAKTRVRKKGKAQRVSRHASMALYARTALELMTANPISIEAGATIKQAATLLFDNGFSAAPVIDESRRPIGVLSRADLLWFERERVRHAAPTHDFYQTSELSMPNQTQVCGGSLFEKGGDLPVREIMTSTVYAVSPEAAIPQVVEEMLDRRVHRLFVVDREGILVGVISALDVIKGLSRCSGCIPKVRRIS